MIENLQVIATGVFIIAISLAALSLIPVFLKGAVSVEGIHDVEVVLLC